MASLVQDSDIQALKSRVNIADVIGDHVTLKRAGINSLKGLCPFHDERTPSFTVSPNMGRYHCFGCQASGDAISFLMQFQHLSFVEALEQLAERVGYQLTYTDGPDAPKGPKKTRLYAAHQVAQEFYQAQLFSPQGLAAREFLYNRGFDDQALKAFGIGYAPDSWHELANLLKQKGFSLEEATTSGLVMQGSRGAYDRFRARPVWPIRDTTGQVVGFGARKIFDTDQGPKYLNSPESPIYRKSQVLYGIDLARKAIAADKRAIIVEGYTDVMACHLAGVPHAIATCGTAFGSEHISVLRRVLGDDSRSEVIFTFDPDSAGQAAAIKAYGQEQQFNAQTYVANNIYGLDPADLRQQHGDAAVQAMFAEKTPLFEFALRQAVGGYDLNSVAGRHQAIWSAMPIILQIRDNSLRPAYLRELAGIVGVDIAEVKEQMHEFLRSGKQQQVKQSAANNTVPTQAPQFGIVHLPRTPEVRLERDALMAMLQYPEYVGEQLLQNAVAAHYYSPPLQLLAQAIGRAVPDLHDQNKSWIESVVAACDQRVQTLAREMSLQPLPERDAEKTAHYCQQIVISLLLRSLKTVKAELLLQLRRLPDQDSELAQQIGVQLMELETARRQLQNLTER